MTPIALLMLICLSLSLGNCKEKEKKEDAKETTTMKADVAERILQVIPGIPPGVNTPQNTNMASQGQRPRGPPQPPLFPEEGPITPGRFEAQSSIPLQSQAVVENLGKHPLLYYPQNYPNFPTRRSQIDPLRQPRWFQQNNQNVFLPRSRPFQRYRSMFTVPEPGIANVGNLGFPLLSHYDEARAPSGEDFEDPTLLLPKCNDHIPGCNKMRYLIDLFSKNETKHISQKMKDEDFPTRGILLREILQQLMEVDLETEILTKVKEYAHQMEDQPSAPTLEPEYKNLVYALPEPTSDIERITLAELTNWLTNTDISLQMGEDYIPYPHKTKASLLRYIIQKGLKSSKLSDSLKDAMEYWGERIINFGKGAESVDWVIVLKKVRRNTVDMRSMVEVIDKKKLESEKSKRVMKDINEFFEKEFDPEVHMVGLNILKYKTKGELFTAFVENILKKTELSKEVRKNFETVKPFIQLDGPGEEAVEYIN